MALYTSECSKRPSSKAAASEGARCTLRYVEPLSDARTPLEDFFSILLEPLSCREIAEGQDTKDSHNAQHGCPSKRIVKPLE